MSSAAVMHAEPSQPSLGSPESTPSLAAAALPATVAVLPDQGPRTCVGIDTTGDGRADMYISGVDRNGDGIPDCLKGPNGLVALQVSAASAAHSTGASAVSLPAAAPVAVQPSATAAAPFASPPAAQPVTTPPVAQPVGTLAEPVGTQAQPVGTSAQPLGSVSITTKPAQLPAGMATLAQPLQLGMPGAQAMAPSPVTSAPQPVPLAAQPAHAHAVPAHLVDFYNKGFMDALAAAGVPTAQSAFAPQQQAVGQTQTTLGTTQGAATPMPTAQGAFAEPGAAPMPMASGACVPQMPAMGHAQPMMGSQLQLTTQPLGFPPPAFNGQQWSQQQQAFPMPSAPQMPSPAPAALQTQAPVPAAGPPQLAGSPPDRITYGPYSYRLDVESLNMDTPSSYGVAQSQQQQETAKAVVTDTRKKRGIC